MRRLLELMERRPLAERMGRLIEMVHRCLRVQVGVEHRTSAEQGRLAELALVLMEVHCRLEWQVERHTELEGHRMLEAEREAELE